MMNSNNRNTEKLPLGVSVSETVKPLSFSNIYNARVNSQITEAQTLLRYRFSFSNIACFTNLGDKTIRKIRNDLVQRNVLDEESNNAPQEKLLNNYRFKPNKAVYYLNELLILYARFHSEDPNEKFDLESLLIAWNIMDNHCRLANISINDVMCACRMMLKDILLSEDEPTGIWLKFSTALKCFYTYVTNTDSKQDDTGYVELEPLSKIEDRLIRKAQ